MVNIVLGKLNTRYFMPPDLVFNTQDRASNPPFSPLFRGPVSRLEAPPPWDQEAQGHWQSPLHKTLKVFFSKF